VNLDGPAICTAASAETLPQPGSLQATVTTALCPLTGVQAARIDCIPAPITMPPECIMQQAVITCSPLHRSAAQAAFASRGCAATSSTRTNATNWRSLFIASLDYARFAIGGL
jgi:hypothetical protein